MKILEKLSFFAVILLFAQAACGDTRYVQLQEIFNTMGSKKVKTLEVEDLVTGYFTGNTVQGNDQENLRPSYLMAIVQKSELLGNHTFLLAASNSSGLSVETQMRGLRDCNVLSRVFNPLQLEKSGDLVQTWRDPNLFWVVKYNLHADYHKSLTLRAATFVAEEGKPEHKVPVMVLETQQLANALVPAGTDPTYSIFNPKTYTTVDLEQVKPVDCSRFNPKVWTQAEYEAAGGFPHTATPTSSCSPCKFLGEGPVPIGPVGHYYDIYKSGQYNDSSRLFDDLAECNEARRQDDRCRS